MMVDPGWIYEEELKGKDPEYIRKWIRRIQRKIRQLQKMVSEPEKYPNEWMICPSPDVQLEMYLLYLQKAKDALMDAIEYLEDKP